MTSTAGTSHRGGSAANSASGVSAVLNSSTVASGGNGVPSTYSNETHHWSPVYEASVPLASGRHYDRDRSTCVMLVVPGRDRSDGIPSGSLKKSGVCSWLPLHLRAPLCQSSSPCIIVRKISPKQRPELALWSRCTR